MIASTKIFYGTNAKTHAPTCELIKRSLTLPPATLKKAALQKPVRNLKMRKTAVAF